jgi:hypothetical protein
MTQRHARAATALPHGASALQILPPVQFWIAITAQTHPAISCGSQFVTSLTLSNGKRLVEKGQDRSVRMRLTTDRRR